MTVAELIGKLQEMPQGASVTIDVVNEQSGTNAWITTYTGVIVEEVGERVSLIADLFSKQSNQTSDGTIH